MKWINNSKWLAPWICIIIAVVGAGLQPDAVHANTTGVTQATYGSEMNPSLNGLDAANAELSLSATASTAITNGTDWKDTAGNPIQANSGNILKVGSTYYWYGEHAENWKFEKVNVYTSTDLKNWSFRSSILTKDSAPELNSSKIERPKVIYNKSTGKYVLWAHYENGTDYSLGRVAVATSDTPDGNFTYQGSFRPLNYESRDMTVFTDTDGSGYLITASRKNGGANDTMAIFKLTADYTGVQSFVGWIFENGYREAPLL